MHLDGVGERGAVGEDFAQAHGDESRIDRPCARRRRELHLAGVGLRGVGVLPVAGEVHAEHFERVRAGGETAERDGAGADGRVHAIKNRAGADGHGRAPRAAVEPPFEGDEARPADGEIRRGVAGRAARPTGEVSPLGDGPAEVESDRAGPARGRFGLGGVVLRGGVHEERRAREIGAVGRGEDGAGMIETDARVGDLVAQVLVELDLRRIAVVDRIRRRLHRVGIADEARHAADDVVAEIAPVAVRGSAAGVVIDEHVHDRAFHVLLDEIRRARRVVKVGVHVRDGVVLDEGGDLQLAVDEVIHVEDEVARDHVGRARARAVGADGVRVAGVARVLILRAVLDDVVRDQRVAFQIHVLIAGEAVEVVVAAVEREAGTDAPAVAVEDIVVALVAVEVIEVNAEPAADGEAADEVRVAGERAVGGFVFDLERLLLVVRAGDEIRGRCLGGVKHVAEGAARDGELRAAPVAPAQVRAAPGAVVHPRPRADDAERAPVFLIRLQHVHGRGALGVDEIAVAHDVFLRERTDDAQATPFRRAGLDEVLDRIAVACRDRPRHMRKDDVLRRGALGEQLAVHGDALVLRDLHRGAGLDRQRHAGGNREVVRDVIRPARRRPGDRPAADHTARQRAHVDARAIGIRLGGVSAVDAQRDRLEAEILRCRVRKQRVGGDVAGLRGRRRIDRVRATLLVIAGVGDRREREGTHRPVIVLDRRDAGKDRVLHVEGELRVRPRAVFVARENRDVVIRDPAGLIGGVRRVRGGDDRATLDRGGVKGRLVADLRFRGDAEVAIHNLRAAHSDVVLQQRDAFVESVAQHAILDGESPREAVERVVIANAEDAPAQIHRQPAGVVDVDAVLVVLRAGLAVSREHFREIGILDGERAAGDFGPGDRAAAVRAPESDRRISRVEKDLPWAVREHRILNQQRAAGDAQHRPGAGVPAARGVARAAEQAILQRHRAGGGLVDFAPPVCGVGAGE